jgi:biotin-(acetyl-CoA carboxylase) ligase
VIRPEEPEEPSENAIRDLGVLPLTASVAVAEALWESAEIASKLRWPNDLFFADRKLGGILCESSFVGQRCEFAVVGIGVNVNQAAEDFRGELSSRATSVGAILGRAMDPLEIALAIVIAFEKWWERESRPRILQRWRELAGGLEGAPVRVVPHEGNAYAARIAGLADDGGLEVCLEDGTMRTLRSDDVHLQQDGERRLEEDRALDEGYYEEVESYFVTRRGSPLFITPSEWDLVWRWEQEGIPVTVVKEGIDRVFERPKTLLKARRLGYCRQTVEAAFRRSRESSLGGGTGGTARDDSSASAHLTEVSSRLRDLAAAWSETERELADLLEQTADAVRSLSGGAEEAPLEVERELTALDGKLVIESEAVLGDAVREELRGDVESSLESYRERMPEKIYRAALESGYRRRLRKRIGLPTLSLYSR